MAVDIPSSPAVEATSLASVLELASNPPAQPLSRQTGARPLTLYIARVPGSRDVFLTPVKPREKIVTASDVQSSLYYVHMHDVPAQQKVGPATNSKAGTNAPALPVRKEIPPPLPRRPAPPASPPYPVEDRMPALPPRPTHVPRQISRKPLLPIRSKSRDLLLDLPVLPPRPLPPTPPQETQDDLQTSSLHQDNVRLLREESHTDAMSNPYNRDYSSYADSTNTSEPDSGLEPGSLTLIRRNAASNEQWNVATIHDPPVMEISSSSLLIPTAKRRTKKGGAPLYLDITNPGYSQFAPIAPRTDSRVSSSTRSSSEESEPPPPTEGSFRRRLYMPGSKYAEHGYNKQSHHRKQLSASSAGSTSNESILMLNTLRGERHSVDLGSPNMSASNRRSRGYTFASPWDSTCEFTTGSTGRTLKCRHHVPASIHGAARAVEVSELRFNLPSSAKSSMPPTSAPSRVSYFANRGHLFDSLAEGGSQSPSIVLDEEGRIDLTLGRERAGGGFGGKQAKLGKLIIEPEGMGMLDLLVAANVGLWFRAWEKL